MVSRVREFRAGELDLFAPPGKPGPPPGTAPAKDRARARVIELRREGLSTRDTARLPAEGTPLNRTRVGQILAEEGFGRLVRGPQPESQQPARPPQAGTPSSPGRGHRLRHLPRPAETRRAGLLLAVPDLVTLDLPALAGRAGYPGTWVIPAVSWLLSLLALKLTRTRRVSHVDDLLTDPAAGLLAGLAVLPKKSAAPPSPGTGPRSPSPWPRRPGRGGRSTIGTAMA